MSDSLAIEGIARATYSEKDENLAYCVAGLSVSVWRGRCEYVVKVLTREQNYSACLGTLDAVHCGLCI